ncbi:hypothetical protein AU825_21035 [Salmonella enterica subsp. salamae]|nr:hypothetical protein [Salmonella enterica subsp. salamae]
MRKGERTLKSGRLKDRRKIQGDPCALPGSPYNSPPVAQCPSYGVNAAYFPHKKAWKIAGK